MSASLLVLAVAATLAVALTSCGSSGGAKLLPGATATQINANLDQVQQLADEGDCVGAADAAAAVSDQVDELGGVDQKLKQALGEGAERLNEVVAGCEEEESEELDEALQEAEEAEAEEKPEKAVKPEKKPKKEKEAPPETIEPPGQEEGEGEPSLGEEEGGPGAGGVGPGEPAEEG